MAPLLPMDPRSVPLHVLFPEDYQRSARMVSRDFVLLGGVLVAGLVGAAFLAQIA